MACKPAQAWPMTASSAPGSGKRWVAPGTISKTFGLFSRASACSLFNTDEGSPVQWLDRTQYAARRFPWRWDLRCPRDLRGPNLERGVHLDLGDDPHQLGRGIFDLCRDQRRDLP